MPTSSDSGSSLTPTWMKCVSWEPQGGKPTRLVRAHRCDQSDSLHLAQLMATIHHSPLPVSTDPPQCCRIYEVIAASNQTGIATTWSREYDYAQTYHEAQFSPSTVKELILGFENDRGAKDGGQPGLHSQLLCRRPLFRTENRSGHCTSARWANHTGKAFAACVCSPASKDVACPNSQTQSSYAAGPVAGVFAVKPRAVRSGLH